jgi:hypothetical protein
LEKVSKPLENTFAMVRKKMDFYGYFGGSFRVVSGYHGEIDSQAVAKQRGHVTNVKLLLPLAIQWLRLLVINLTTLNRTKLVDTAQEVDQLREGWRTKLDVPCRKALITRRN